MSAVLVGRGDPRATLAASGIAPHSASLLLRLFDGTPGIERVLLFGSRGRGDFHPQSDIDLAVDAPGLDTQGFASLQRQLDALNLIYRVDLVWLQDRLDDRFRGFIERDGRVFWAPRRQSADVDAVGGVQLKDFQTEVLRALGRYIEELKRQAEPAERNRKALRAMEGLDEAVARDAGDFPKKTWAALQAAGALPPAFAERPHSSRWTGEPGAAGRAIPNVCLKVPTGGGKTLLAAASVARVFSSYLGRHTGLVLWVVPNEAIYRQTFKALSDRDHPYRQILNVAAAGRVKILDKNSPLTRLDVDSHLCVMVLMLASAARQSKETLRFFKDRGNVLGFLPREDDVEAHWKLLAEVPNLDVYAPWGASQEGARAQKGSIAKSSLGNVMRLLRPMVVIDEGHHGYTENALKTLDGFNPCFLLELSATPRVASARGSGSNILVDVRGTDLDEAQMIKLPIHVDVRHWSDWQSCLAAAVQQLDELQREAEALRGETARYIRPLLLVQVERTGADQRDAGYIHADDARDYLMQLGFAASQIAIKTAERDELKQPENIDLLSPTCELRAIITKQALQEGWDCPFAYVLCALAAGRNPGAMTQLVGRILRQPQTVKTGRPALDACYVLCHDARTATVVGAIKKSLEGEGMGDLGVTVRSDGDADGVPKTLRLKRRAGFEKLRIFLPRVTWVEAGAADAPPRRRDLDYDSDVLAGVDWSQLDPDRLAEDWARLAGMPAAERFDVTMDILDRAGYTPGSAAAATEAPLDRARLVRALIDLVPNAWQVWEWVERVVARLLAAGYAEAALAASGASLIERLRADLETERDRLADAAFAARVAEGRIEFALRADATDYELPCDFEMPAPDKPAPLMRDDLRAVEKSLLEPMLRTPDLNDYEVNVAGYLDQQAALQWWHRNVAKSQYGLQGWKRHKVYPDFVFAQLTGEGRKRVVLLETKGLHLQGSADTDYKRRLLERLGGIYQDSLDRRAGELVLERETGEDIVCDLLFDAAAWRNALQARWFAD